jgi:ubiquitin carboxyl-terminal hydrolase 10
MYAGKPLDPLPTTSRPAEDSGWKEVGKRQRPADTHSSGPSNTPSAITSIFGGQYRSEFKVSGKAPSITLEEFRTVPLDIAGEARNVVDALRGMTRPESVDGNFDSPHGPNMKATKQVLIEKLPLVLILHLKRFQFEGTGTVKIYKKIGYPLNLEVPREILGGEAKQKAAQDVNHRRYKLTAVVYHHGKNANDGHYTVDVRRQDGQDWLRIDDTVLHRVNSEDVAEGGAEDKTKHMQADSRRESSNTASNRYSGIEDDTGEDSEWKTPKSGNKKWSAVASGSSAPTANGRKSKQVKTNVKDNKVAYLLFYQRIEPSSRG